MAQRAWCGRALRAACAMVLAAGLGGCAGFAPGKPPGPWYNAYQPIDDSVSDAFVSNTLARAVAEFGAPVVPVNHVMLRRSRKTPEARRYAIEQDFTLTECVDPTNGVFVVYMAVDPGHRNYFPLLAHECAHLIDPYVFDWYMEGVATVFSEEVCVADGLEWGDWKRHFMRSRREPYALSYRMMLELKQALPYEYPAMVRCTLPSPREDGRKRIDIDAWLGSLDDARRKTALDIIAEYAPALGKDANAQYNFTVPQALK